LDSPKEYDSVISIEMGIQLARGDVQLHVGQETALLSTTDFQLN
jgi:hypothetical protein